MRLLFGDCTIEVERRELLRAGESIHVEPQVFDLLIHLIDNRHRVVSKDDLVAAIWRRRVISDSTLNNRINAARQAIGDDGERQQLIRTIARRGFRFVGDIQQECVNAAQAPPSFAEPVADRSAAAESREKPSIAVLPFANLSGDPEQDYFAEGMAQDVIASLSQIRWLAVIGSSSSFSFKGRAIGAREIGRELNVRYLLDGSVRRAQDRVRITGQLIEAESGIDLWAGKFDGHLTDIFDLQDQIAANVVGAIEPSLRGAEIERAKRKRPDNLSAYDLYLRALSHAYAYTREGRNLAIGLLTQALTVDPNYVEAHGLAAWCYVQRLQNESMQSEPDRSGALAHAKAVIAKGTRDAATLAFAANAYAVTTQDHATAVGMIDQALAYSPSSAHALCFGAVVNAWAGHSDKAIDLAERALRCSPLDPVRHLALAAYARAKLFRGEAEAALAAARRAVQASPGHLASRGYVVISLVRLGRSDELRMTVDRMRADFPDAGLRQFAGYRTFDPFADDFRAAGLPE